MKIYQPHNQTECAQILAELALNAQSVRLVSEALATQCDSVDRLSTQLLDDLVFFDVEDMVIGVEAGMPYQKFQQTVVEQGMYLPVNAWCPTDRMSRVVASNYFGPDRMFGGGIRDFIIGITYVDANGRLHQQGGKVVKNVTGYDLSRMMIGSRGGLGCLTSVNLKLNPVPKNPFVFYCESQTLTPVSEVQQLGAQRLPLDWCQVRLVEGSCLVAFGISGNRARLEALTQRVLQELGAGWSHCPDQELPNSWLWAGFRQRLGGCLQGLPQAYLQSGYHLHLQAPTSEWNEPFMQRLRRDQLAAIIHPFGGDGHVFFLPQKSEEAWVAEVVQTCLPTARAEWINAPNQILNTTGRVIPLPNGYEMMTYLRQQLDPDGRFLAPFYSL